MRPTVVVVGGASVEAERSLLSSRFERVLAIEDASGDLGLIADEQTQLVVLGPDVPTEAALGVLLSLAASPASSPVVALARGTDGDRSARLKSAGAFECLPSPLTEDAMKRLLSRLKADREQRSAMERFLCPPCPAGVLIVGRSPGLVAAVEMLKKVSESLCNPILILGETGTGKELAARAVHAWRCGDPDKFIAVNCATLNANLLESELFGHVKGSFTGADREKQGLLEVADTGTIFLDEISEMPLELQAKLLRFLQERKFRKVGGTADIRSRATVVASSNRSLFEESGAGRFRKDLYYRLAVFPVELPPLRAPQRCGDILLLAEYFLQTSKVPRGAAIRGLSEGARRRLLSHAWPGNVRELQNVIERAVILETTDQITPSSVVIDGESPLEVGPALPGQGPAAPGRGPAPAQEGNEFSLETAEKEFIYRALQVAGWHRTRAADLLGITRATLHAKIKRYDIHIPSAQQEPAPPQRSPAAGPAASEKLAHPG